VPRAALTARIACQALARAGLDLEPGDVEVEARDERWLVRLPNRRLAWFARTDDGLQRLRNERRVLRLLQMRCTFGAPRLLYEHDDGEYDVRTMVLGVSDPWRIFADVRDDTSLAMRIGAAIGRMLAEQHSRISAADVPWLPRRPAWPKSRAWIAARLPSVVKDRALIADADAIMRAYDETVVTRNDRALVHTDVGFHNLGIDPTTYTVHGLFDYDGAAWADRHHDFRYLVFDLDRYDLLDAAVAVYNTVVERQIHRRRVLLYNAACAVTFLANRVDTPPDERSCGRTLDEDIGWSKHAITRALGR
jgi:hypothetical protein